MRVVEQSLADLEIRRGGDAKEFAERIDAAIEAVEQRQKRLENADSRQQLGLAELRLELLDLTNRTKRPAGDDPGTAGEQQDPAAATVSQSADFRPWKNSPETEATNSIRALPEGQKQSYLSSARRAAIDAAVAAQDGGETGKRRVLWHWLLGTVIAAAAVLGLVTAMRSDVAVPSVSTFKLTEHSDRQPTTRQAARSTVTALAKAGNADAQLILGLRLLNGAGVTMNIEKAADWLERAASGKQPVAQETIGVLYQTGTGVVANVPKAIRWYEAAARLGNVKAMANLGKVHAGGWSEGTNFAKAAQWFARAASFGDVDAQFDLAVLYERGEGVPYSPDDAYKWYAIAAAQGDYDAATQAGLVAKRLSPDELQAAKNAAADFRPRPVNRTANDIPQLAAPDAADTIK
jgi:TPR repeat protein